MATTYPWAGFGSFKHQGNEKPLPGTDAGWVLSPNVGRARPLGSTRDSIQVMSVGSAERQFEMIIDADRYATFRALINTTGVVTDWTRPTPETQEAFLLNVVPLDREVYRLCGVEAVMKRAVRCRVTYVSQ